MKKLLTIACILFSCNSFAAIKTYYFSASGNDLNTGLSSGSPYTSAARFNSLTLNAGDVVLFNRGDVFYGQWVIHNSGSSGSPITIGAYGTGANPVITGFTNVVAWTNLGSNIWESTFAVSTLSSLNMVTVNGVNTAMGRTPNTGSYFYQSHTGVGGNITSSNIGTTNWTGAELAMYVTTFTIGRYPITSQSGSTLFYTPVGGDENIQRNGQAFIIQNDSRTLDAQNEWYYNPTTKKIRIYSTSMPSGVQISTIDTVFSIVSQSYITVDGISLQGSNKTLIEVRGATHVTIQNCYFKYAGKDAIHGEFGGGSGGSNTFTANNNILSNCNNGGIQLEADFHEATISNNLIDSTGSIPFMIASQGNSGQGISATGANSVIENNTVKNSSYNGINFLGNNTLVENNLIDGYNLQQTDGGGIYTGNGSGVTYSGTQILNNIVLNGPQGNGIYCDDKSNGIEVAGNTVFNSLVGIYLHNSYNINAHHNTAYDSKNYCLSVRNDDAAVTVNGLTIKNNKFIAKDAIQKVAFYDGIDRYMSGIILDSNYYCRPIDDNLTFLTELSTGVTTDRSLAMMQTYLGQDAHSKKSPLTITNVNQLSSYYALVDSNVNTIPGKDMTGTDYTGTTALPAYSSLVLIQTASLIPVDISWTPAPFNYLTGVGPGQLNAVATAAGNPVNGTHVYNYGSGAILPAGIDSLKDVFTPADQSTYAIANKTVPVTVNQDTAILSWLHLTDLIYNGLPQAPQVVTNPVGLNTTQVLLNNVVSSEVNAGNYSAIGALNNSNFKSTAITGTFIINKKTLVITCHSDTFFYDGNNHFVLATNPDNVPMIYSYPDGTPIGSPSGTQTFRQVVSMNQQNYQATPDTVLITIVNNPAIIFISDTLKTYTGSAQSVTVTSPYSYSLTNGTRTNAGSQQVIATINDGIHTGADTANLTIAKRQAILTWSTPQPIASDVSINSVQLNPTSDIAGNFIFSPLAGTKFQPGDYTLSATFVPTDSANNVGGTISVRLHVYGSPLLDFILTNSIYKSLPR